MKKIALIGSTGSIGVQVLNVVRRHPDKFKITAMVCSSSSEVFLQQINEFKPEYCCICNKIEGEKIKAEIPKGVIFTVGEDEALSVAGYNNADIVFVSAGGFAGLKYVLKAIECKKDIALANKESLVCGGELVMKRAKANGVKIMPVDSEHSAIWQALGFDCNKPFSKLIITASGGPFYKLSESELNNTTVAEALNHPTWKMGAKITIDSATLLNKGFEVIEAKWLYNTSIDSIETIIHPQSIIHSMVEFADGVVMAQMSYPSMETPITLALTYPERIDCGLKSLNFKELKSLDFVELNRKKFPCYDLALKSVESGGTMPTILNASGEIAVRYFLNGLIKFNDIHKIIDSALQKIQKQKIVSYSDIERADKKTRELTQKIIQNL